MAYEFAPTGDSVTCRLGRGTKPDISQLMPATLGLAALGLAYREPLAATSRRARQLRMSEGARAVRAEPSTTNTAPA